jgi:N-methylhydantoinase A
MAALSGYRNIVTLDLGGTTAKASIVEEGEVAKSSEMEVGGGENFASKTAMGRGHALKLPAIDVSEVGAGGGSLVSVDRYGRLLVGPKSAGAVPGPVCYDLGGTQVTLTDALVVLGYLNPAYLVGGEMLISLGKASEAMCRQVAEPLGKGLVEAAHGIIQVATINMMAAVRSVSTNRGRDPRDFDLFAFGGTGPVLAADLARQLGMGRVVVPMHPGLFSAFGLLHSKNEYDYVQTFLRSAGKIDSTELEAAFQKIEDRACKTLTADGYCLNEIATRRQVDFQYVGQAYELKVLVKPGQPVSEMVEAFEVEHERNYGHRAANGEVKLVSLRVIASVETSSEQTAWAVTDPTANKIEESNLLLEREAYFGEEHGQLKTPVFVRAELSTNSRKGPLIIEEYDSTVIVPPDWSVRLDRQQNIVLECEQGK